MRSKFSEFLNFQNFDEFTKFWWIFKIVTISSLHLIQKKYHIVLHLFLTSTGNGNPGRIAGPVLEEDKEDHLRIPINIEISSFDSDHCEDVPKYKH